MKSKESILEYHSRISFVEWTPKEREVIFDAMTEYAQSKQTGTNPHVSGLFYCVSSDALVHGKPCEQWCGNPHCKDLVKQ